MKTKFLILLLALFGAESVAANEAIKCYETAWVLLGLTTGQAREGVKADLGAADDQHRR